MVDYQAIAELVSQIPVDTWNLLREIKQRRPAMIKILGLFEHFGCDKVGSATRHRA